MIVKSDVPYTNVFTRVVMNKICKNKKNNGKANKHETVVHASVCVCFQSTVIADLFRLGELDSDMADITQSLPAESMLGGEDDGELPLGDADMSFGKLGGVVASEHDCVSASGHIASSLGINPHTLQVRRMPSASDKEKTKTSDGCRLPFGL